MIDFYKNIAKGTEYEFLNNKTTSSYFPRKITNSTHVNKKLPIKIIENEWYDKQGCSYRLQDNALYINAYDYFSNTPYSVADYINEIPNGEISLVILIISSRSNELAGFNELCYELSKKRTKINILLDMTNMKFSEKGVSLELEGLPSNVKITCMMNYYNNQEDFIKVNRCFESYALNCNDKDFEVLLSKVTPKLKERLAKMHEIAKEFYYRMPMNIKNGNNKDKLDYAFSWCVRNIGYDSSATKDDGTLNLGRHDSQDPLVTLKNRKGVCEGRARLLKMLLNNYYMQVPCFLVDGMTRGLQHEWNEVILEDGTIIDCDISHERNRCAYDHSDRERYIGLNSFTKK